MGTVSLKGIKKVYENGFEAVKGFDLEIHDNEFIVLVGPSGCGKTTTLRMIAGLEDITAGDLLIDDEIMNNLPPKDRNIAMVFQNYALYPHMTVYDNMAFGLKLRKFSKADIETKVTEAANILGIEDLLKRKPKQLSGGQRQRVALGRAIVRNPKIFLMDEPLSNLDAKLRVLMRTEISKLHRKLNTTFVYVTHDQTEAMTMGTRIVVMKDGFVQQVDTPADTYKYPKNLFVASFIGSPEINILEATVIEEAGKVLALYKEVDSKTGNTTEFKFKLDDTRAAVLKEKGYVGKQVCMGLRPEHIKIYDDFERTDDMTDIKVKVEVAEMMGAEIFVYFLSNGNQYVSKVKASSNLKVGDTATLSIKGSRIHMFDKETEQSIFER